MMLTKGHYLASASLLAAALLAANPAQAATAKAGEPCTLAHLHVVQLLTHSQVDDTNSKYQLVIDGKTTPAFADKPFAPDTLTEVKAAQCKHGSYVFALDFGSPYYKGFAIRYNPRRKALERIDFAEKALPAYLVNAADGFSLVMNNEEADPSSPWIAYRYTGQASDPSEKQYLEALPRNAKALR